MENDLIFFQTEEDLDFSQMKDDLKFFEKGRRQNLIQMKDDLNILANVRQPQKKIMQPKTIKIKTMVDVAPLGVT